MKKNEVQQYIGNLAQIGGSRHYVLTDGWGRNLRCIDINSGCGLQYTILPDRGMDISLASFKGTNLVYLTCNGETHPSYFEPENFGWLHTFAGGLLTTCGLTYLGSPVIDDGEQLGLHGRYSTIPARQVADLSEWVNGELIIRIKGTIEEGTIFGNKLRLEREITTIQGQNRITIRDKITNFGYKPSPYMILYHMNLGYPLLNEDSELIINPAKTTPQNAAAKADLTKYKMFIKPLASYQEQVFCHTMKASENGETSATIKNHQLGIALTIKFNTHQLPYLIQWKMMGKGEYVLGLEPSNVPGKNRKDLKNENILPYLQPSESIINNLEVVLSEINKKK
ncbi:MAG: aldose 1-epimerase family protein [Bacteroidales bacterium]